MLGQIGSVLTSSRTESTIYILLVSYLFTVADIAKNEMSVILLQYSKEFFTSSSLLKKIGLIRGIYGIFNRKQYISGERTKNCKIIFCCGCLPSAQRGRELITTPQDYGELPVE
jgi:hypothetical protein